MRPFREVLAKNGDLVAQLANVYPRMLKDDRPPEPVDPDLVVAQVTAVAADYGPPIAHLYDLTLLGLRSGTLSDVSMWNTRRTDRLQLPFAVDELVLVDTTAATRSAWAIASPEPELATPFYGTPTGVFSSGATITLIRSDVKGTALSGPPNVAVYLQASQASYAMHYSTTIPTGTVIPFMKGADGLYYVLGAPRVIQTVAWSSGTMQLTFTARDDWGLFSGTESAEQEIFQAVSKTVLTDYGITSLEFTKDTSDVVVIASDNDQAGVNIHDGTNCPESGS